MKIMKIYRKFYGSQYSIKLFIGKKIWSIYVYGFNAVFTISSQILLTFCLCWNFAPFINFVKSFMQFFICWLIDVGSRIGHGLQVYDYRFKIPDVDKKKHFL